MATTIKKDDDADATPAIATQQNAAVQPTATQQNVNAVLPTAIQQENKVVGAQPIDSTASDLKDIHGVSLPDSKYPTAFYIGSGIPYCKKCGEQYLSNLDGSPRCAEALSDCPRTNAHS